MTRRVLRDYGLALVFVTAVAGLRLALIPALGPRPSVGAFVLSVLLSGRYLGFGPSIFALLAGIVPGVGLQLLGAANDPTQPSIQATVVAYLILGGIVAFLCKSEHDARSELTRENDERRAIEAELRESQQRLLMALEAGRLGAWEIDLRTNEVKWSDLMAPMHGFAPGEFDGTFDTALSHTPPEDQERLREALALAVAGQAPESMTYRVRLPNGKTRWIEVAGKGFPAFPAAPVRVLGICKDVTEQLEAETALRQAEERFRTLAVHAPVVIYQADREGRCTFVNQKWCEIAGEKPEDALGESWQKYLHPDDRQRYLEEWRESIRLDHPFLSEVRMVHASSGVHWVMSSATALRDASGDVTGYIGTAVDITDRKRALESLESEQELLRHTIQLQDQERQLISYEIHDGLVQYVTGALMQLQALHDKVRDSELAREFEPVLTGLQKAVAEGRRVVNGIRTPVLDDWGIVAALEYLIEEEDRAHVQIEFIKPDDLGRMAPSVEEALFRIAQEAITNARKHSRTDKLRIELKRQGDRVRLEIRDWGVGFSPAVQSKGVHGIKSMCERARIAGGQCTIESAPGSGALVVVDLPYTPRQACGPRACPGADAIQ
jgi:PAS domain S-box-containing protein